MQKEEQLLSSITLVIIMWENIIYYSKINKINLLYHVPKSFF